MKLTGNLDLSRYAYAEDVARRRLGAANAKTIFDVGAGDAIMRRPLEAAGFTWLGFDIAVRDGISRWDLGNPCPVQDKAARPRPLARRDRASLQSGHRAGPHCGNDGARRDIADNDAKPAVEPKPAVGVAERLSRLLHPGRSRFERPCFPGLAAHFGTHADRAGIYDCRICHVGRRNDLARRTLFAALSSPLGGRRNNVGAGAPRPHCLRHVVRGRCKFGRLSRRSAAHPHRLTRWIVSSLPATARSFW